MVAIARPQVHLWTREEYNRMASMGLFEERRVELIEGQVIDMAAMKSPHAVAVDLADAALKAIFGMGYYIRQQKPFVISDISEPDPDIAVIKGNIRDFADAHPTVAELIIEVADSSLSYDHNIKGSLYAKAAIADYWIFNVIDRQLEVYRQPVPDADAKYGFRYGVSEIYRSGQQVAPLSIPNLTVAVTDMLP
ncbi:MAG: Uma2 family endonuclease [Cyanobacteria bacterium J06635_1]